MSVVSVEDVEGVMSTGLDPAVLQKVIDREEDWLANDQQNGIGQLVGARTQTVYRSQGSLDPIYLARPTLAIAVVEGTQILDPTEVVLVGRMRVEHKRGFWNAASIAVTYDPSDALQVEAAILELVQLRISSSPFSQESSEGGHSYSRPVNVQQQRVSIARSVHPAIDHASVKIRADRILSAQ